MQLPCPSLRQERGSAGRALGAPDFGGDRPGIADRLDEMHLIADLELVEIAVHQTVAVEIELSSFMRQQEPVILLRVKLADLPGKGCIVDLHLTSLLALVVEE